jgi:PASTA domain
VSPPPAGWLGVLLAASLGALAGVVATLVLGGGTSARIETITVPAKPPEDTALVSRAPVPAVAAQRLDRAKARLRDAGFLVEVEGGGLFGVLLDRNWRVTGQDPAAGVSLPVGSTVRLRARPT